MYSMSRDRQEPVRWPLNLKEEYLRFEQHKFILTQVQGKSKKGTEYKGVPKIFKTI